MRQFWIGKFWNQQAILRLGEEMMIDFEKSFVFDTVPFHAAFSWEEICYFDYSSNTGIKHVRMSLFLLWYCLNIQELTKYSETFFYHFFVKSKRLYFVTDQSFSSGESSKLRLNPWTEWMWWFDFVVAFFWDVNRNNFLVALKGEGQDACQAA